MEKGALMASPSGSLRPPGARSAVGTRIDRFSSILFPSAFALFNVCYWLVLTFFLGLLWFFFLKCGA